MDYTTHSGFATPEPFADTSDARSPLQRLAFSEAVPQTDTANTIQLSETFFRYLEDEPLNTTDTRGLVGLLWSIFLEGDARGQAHDNDQLNHFVDDCVVNFQREFATGSPDEQTTVDIGSLLLWVHGQAELYSHNVSELPLYSALYMPPDPYQQYAFLDGSFSDIGLECSRINNIPVFNVEPVVDLFCVTQAMDWMGDCLKTYNLATNAIHCFDLLLGTGFNRTIPNYQVLLFRELCLNTIPLQGGRVTIDMFEDFAMLIE